MKKNRGVPTEQPAVKPIVKWAGGKTQLLDKIEARLPERLRESGTIESYVEPFAGSGAVFFHLVSNYEVGNVCLVDINRELIVVYRVVQRDVEELINRLSAVETRYLELDEEERERFFYEIRDEYNQQMLSFDYAEYSEEWIARAVLFLFMNRTCFNGLFRQNQSGEFNVPHGDYNNPTICMTERLLRAHEVLQDTTVLLGEFTEAEEHISGDSFVYFDPPYVPLNETSNFTSYTKEDFGLEDQERLADFFRRMDDRGADLMLSNSDPRNEDPEEDFLDDLYEGFKIERVPARRAINSKGDRRGEINELIITNY